MDELELLSNLTDTVVFNLAAAKQVQLSNILELLQLLDTRISEIPALSHRQDLDASKSSSGDVLEDPVLCGVDTDVGVAHLLSVRVFLDDLIVEYLKRVAVQSAGLLHVLEMDVLQHPLRLLVQEDVDVRLSQE